MTATQAGQPARDPRDDYTADAVPAGAGLALPARLPGAAERIAALRARLVTPMPGDRLWGWVGPLLVTLFAGFLRFNRLSVPGAVIFDETYYAKDAWSILKHGVEWYWIGPPSVNANYVNNQIVAGHFSQHLFAACTGSGCGEYVVQPEG